MNPEVLSFYLQKNNSKVKSRVFSFGKCLNFQNFNTIQLFDHNVDGKSGIQFQSDLIKKNRLAS